MEEKSKRLSPVRKDFSTRFKAIAIREALQSEVDGRVIRGITEKIEREPSKLRDQSERESR